MLQGRMFIRNREVGMRRMGWMALAMFSATMFTFSAGAQQGSGNGRTMQGVDERSFATEQFSDRKARVLRMIEERRTRLDQEKTCVEAATTEEELMKCRPERPAGKGEGFPGGSQGRQEQQRTMQ